jgi:hypothetical protein
MIGPLVLAVAVSAQDQAFVEAAAKCGFALNEIVWQADGQGQRHPLLMPNIDPEKPDFTPFKCMLAWSQRTGAKIGFVSEPPPSR